MASTSSPPSSSSASASDWSQSSPPLRCVKRGNGNGDTTEGSNNVAERRLRSDSSDESVADRPGKNLLRFREEISFGAKFKRLLVLATD